VGQVAAAVAEPPAGPEGRTRRRLFVDAVIFGARTGIQWRDFPERFGKWKSVYNRFRTGAGRTAGRRSSENFR
jgi:transposase